MSYSPSSKRYDSMTYNRCGRSGVLLPAISLGLWHNFGGNDVYENGRAMVRYAFDNGITHFDLANNYGPPPGSAEEHFGRMLKQDFQGYRDEMIISSKAGYRMWPGPYGEWGSRKYLIASLDQSLQRMGLDYVDIFYSHRFDPNTPLEETMAALDHIVRSGKALYAGISSYSAEQTKQASDILKKLGTPCLIHQPVYNITNRWVEDGLLDVLDEEGIGSIAFCPLAQGLLTNKYLQGVPEGSRATRSQGVKDKAVSDHLLGQLRKLNDLAAERGQSLAQMSLSWVLRKGRITTALIGASRVGQIEENLQAIGRSDFSDEELRRIDDIMKQ